ncbi:hypothetical protein [Epibacterium sp. MM17-32]|uniref:hypothetical protein n=1 Tax=Epibacterium sp. MM17-32 TaxID=2917734 RepID=UPI001EF633E1|nr:hypothetical protein [Epibacterium sp. MM17-32]
MLHTRAKVHESRGEYDRGAELRARRLRELLPKHVKRKDFVAILEIMAELERTYRAGQYQAGRLIAQQLVSEPGRKRLLRCALKARKRFKESAFLTHLIALCRAMDNNYHAANRSLVHAIAHPFDAPEALVSRRFKLLQSTWRAVDQIAREQMDWADEGGAYRRIFSAKAPNVSGQVVTASDIETDSKAEKQFLSFKEYALQGRDREGYLKICDAEFAAARALGGKLQAVEDMMRTGIRHVPDYTSSYDLARTRLHDLAPELENLFSEDALQKDMVATVLALCSWLNLARRLGIVDTEARIIAQLKGLSERDELLPALWPAPAAIARSDGYIDCAAQIAGKLERLPPKINRDMQFYFRWAMIARAYDKADAFFAALPKSMRRRHGLLYYANILQRQGRFKEALEIVGEVHGQILSNPSALNGYTNYSLIKRAGELRFLIETAKIFTSVPQPRDPKGVVLIAPRNIDHLRRYPLMVLLEFKKRGWAVVPLVEGLLPRELTGDASIDVMNGAISPTIRLRKKAREVMPDVTDFHVDIRSGLLRWGDIDLSHPVWEDAAINRRRYSINYDCPELQRYLGGLADWTRSMARVLQYARAHQRQSGRKTACISLFSYRLPDALFRFFCDKHGDAESFFYLAAANGYQNYFTNFSTNVSQRFVLRNMTENPHVRSASFPLPENFEKYYHEKQAEIPEILQRFAPITKVKRSTEGTSGRPVEADELDQRIRSWRARGGKVVCAFGKVVCDSGVPFDGGPAHADMKDWINHCVRAVQGTDTLLLIKPHPHELNNQIATFPTEYFRDLIDEPLGDNAVFLGHRWFDIHDMKDRMDLGLIYNGTTTVELGLLGIPCVLAGHYAPIDYPIGHFQPANREEFEACLRFEKTVEVAPDLVERAAVWLDYMANDNFTQSYRFHARPVTNKVLYPPYWFKEDLDSYRAGQSPAVAELIGRALGERSEPGAAPVMAAASL